MRLANDIGRDAPATTGRLAWLGRPGRVAAWSACGLSLPIIDRAPPEFLSFSGWVRHGQTGLKPRQALPEPFKIGYLKAFSTAGHQ